MALTELVERVPASGELGVDAAEAEGGTVRLTVTGAGGDAPASLAMRLAEQLIKAQGGDLRSDGALVTIELPAEGLRRARS